MNVNFNTIGYVLFVDVFYTLRNQQFPVLLEMVFVGHLYHRYSIIFLLLLTVAILFLTAVSLFVCLLVVLSLILALFFQAFVFLKIFHSSSTRCMGSIPEVSWFVGNMGAYETVVECRGDMVRTALFVYCRWHICCRQQILHDLRLTQFC